MCLCRHRTLHAITRNYGPEQYSIDACKHCQLNSTTQVLSRPPDQVLTSFSTQPLFKMVLSLLAFLEQALPQQFHLSILVTTLYGNVAFYINN